MIAPPTEKDETPLDLRKLIFLLVGLALITNAFAVFMNWLLLRQIQSGTISPSMSSIPKGFYFDIALPLFVLLELLIVIWFYKFSINMRIGQTSPLKMIFVGASSGLGLVILLTPMLAKVKPLPWLVSLILFYRTSLFTYVASGLVLILLPLAAELVFRGIVYKGLLKHMTFLPGLAITTISFALVWPSICRGYVPAVGLGILTCTLYYRYRLLLPAIVANVAFTVAMVAFFSVRDILHP